MSKTPEKKKMRCIEYRSGYKHQLGRDYKISLNITPEKAYRDDFLAIDKKGNLTIKKGYAWDGTTAIPDTRYNMRASLVHDALYQLMRMKKVSHEKYRDEADLVFEKLCIEDGVLRPLAKIYYWALNKFGKPNADPVNRKKIYYSPYDCFNHEK